MPSIHLYLQVIAKTCPWKGSSSVETKGEAHPLPEDASAGGGPVPLYHWPQTEGPPQAHHGFTSLDCRPSGLTSAAVWHNSSVTPTESHSRSPTRLWSHALPAPGQKPKGTQMLCVR